MGKTAVTCISPWLTQKHPHLRGEDHSNFHPSNQRSETPPPAWGRPINPPAPFLQPWKHPHLRGEDAPENIGQVNGQETPPPAWGRPRRGQHDLFVKRNTPTCVGKTRLKVETTRHFQKHPHLRGEDCRATPSCQVQIETPPPAWGRRNMPTARQTFMRNTPTCVGKTVNVLANASAQKKHPHLRGEDLLMVFRVPFVTETPPPAWGRQNLCNRLNFQERNTPTCVGKTDR